MAYLLARVYLREDDRVEGGLAYRKVLEFLKELGIGGATVLKSIMGYGATKSFHYEGLEALSYSLPVIVEFVDEEPKVLMAVEKLLSRFGPFLSPLRRYRFVFALSHSLGWGYWFCA